MKRQRFHELTTAQWQYIKEIVDTGRSRKYNLLLIVSAIFRITRTGLQWRNLEGNYPPWPVVYYYFRKWQVDGTWTKVLRVLVRKERKRQGREEQASAAAIDSQSVKKASLIRLDTGIDGGKRAQTAFSRGHFRFTAGAAYLFGPRTRWASRHRTALAIRASF